ncbi:MAG: hypothetical protein J6R43_06255 [Paludibacteraceae bacterium]|nr:hypothetical protein [Paludibacteraceae bacterium]
MKNRFCLFALLLGVCLTSCLNSSAPTGAVSEEAVITKFYLYNDSIKGIGDYAFVIDNDSMLIYNSDSIDYGTRIDSLGFVITPRFSSVYVNDTIDLYDKDKLFLDFTKEVKITVVAADEKTSADYRVRVNVHTVDPDTFIWKGVNSEVFVGRADSEKALWFEGRLLYFAMVDNDLVVNESEDGAKWNRVEVSGLDIASMDLNYLVGTEDFIYYFADGELYKSGDGVSWTSEVITGIAVEHLLFAMNGRIFGVTDENRIARLDGASWTDLGRLPSGFPIYGAAVMVAPAPSGRERVFVVGGVDEGGRFLSSVWSSEDGSYWSDMTGGRELFSPRAYAALAQYGDGLMLFGGMAQMDASDVEVVEDAQLYSKDFGLTWGEPKAKSEIGDMYLPRYGHSAVVTPMGYIYLIGGRVVSESTINDVWRGLNYASLPGFRK